MRAALSILGLVIGLAIVMVNLRKQAGQIVRPAASAASAATPGAATLTQAEAVREALRRSADQAAENAATAASEATP